MSPSFYIYCSSLCYTTPSLSKLGFPNHFHQDSSTHMRECQNPIPTSVLGGFLHTTSNSWTPAARTQLHSGTIYLDMTSDYTCWGLSPTRLAPHPPHFECQAQAQVVNLYFWSISCRSEVSTTSFFGLINLLTWITELGETYYFLDHQFIKKGFNSGIARGKSCIG